MIETSHNGEQTYSPREEFEHLVRSLRANLAATLQNLNIPDSEEMADIRKALMVPLRKREIPLADSTEDGTELPSVESFDFKSITKLAHGSGSGALSNDEYIELHRALIQSYDQGFSDVVKMNEVRLFNTIILYIDKRLDPVSNVLSGFAEKYPDIRAINDPNLARVLQGLHSYANMLRQARCTCEEKMFSTWKSIENGVLKDDARATLEILGIVDEDDGFITFAEGNK